MEKEKRHTLTWNEVVKLWPYRSSLKPLRPRLTPRTKIANARPIPRSIQDIVLAKYGQTCAFPGCNNAYAEFHHLIPYAICKKHDPSNIFPVCKTHHTLFHAGLISNSEKNPNLWYIRNKAEQNSIDKKVMKFKMRN